MNLLVKIYKKRYDRHNEWNTLNNRLLQLCVLSCILFIQNQVPYFKAVNDSNRTRLLLRKKEKKRKKKTLKKNAFRSGLPICHKLWDIAFIFLALCIRVWLDLLLVDQLLDLLLGYQLLVFVFRPIVWNINQMNFCHTCFTSTVWNASRDLKQLVNILD